MSKGFFGSQLNHDHDSEMNACDRYEEHAFFEMLHEADFIARSRDDDEDDGMEEQFDTVGEFVKFRFELFNISIHHAIYYYEALNDLPHIMDEVVFINENDEKKEVDFWDLDEDFLATEYPDIAKVAAFFFGVSEQEVISQNEHITDRFLEDKETSDFFTTAWDIKDRTRGRYFKGQVGRNLGGVLTERMSLDEATSIGFENRYDYHSVPERLYKTLKEKGNSVPGLFHPGQKILDLKIYTEHFISCECSDFLEAFFHIAEKLEKLFHKAVNSGLTERERQEYDFYVLALNVKMAIIGSKHAFYRNILVFRDFYKEHVYTDLASYLRFDFWHEDFYQPWRCIEFTDCGNLVQRFFDYVPEAKKAMRQFAMEVGYFKCTYTWSDSPHFSGTPEEEAEEKALMELCGMEYVPPEQRRRVPETFYLEKTAAELEDDYKYAKVLSALASPSHQGGVRVANPEGRLYAKKNWTQVLIKYDYKGGLI